MHSRPTVPNGDKDAIAIYQQAFDRANDRRVSGVDAFVKVVRRGGAHADDGLADTEPPAPSRHVRIVVGFDGSCPHDPAGVKEEGKARFRIFPSWRSTAGIDEEAVGRSTRLGFKVVNTSPVVASVDLSIAWQYHQAPPKDRPNFASEFAGDQGELAAGAKWRIDL